MADDETGALRLALEQSIMATYCEIAALTFLVYDHILTFPGELKLVWGRRFTGATALFLLLRYLTLFSKVSLLVTAVSWPGQTNRNCWAPVLIEEITLMLVYIIVSIFSALRIYAIWEQDWRPALPVLLIGLMVPVANLYHYAQSVPAAFPAPFVGCGEDSVLSEAVFHKLALIIHTSAIVTDTLVIILTWVKTFGLKRAAWKLNLKASLSTILLRDGTIYFGILLALNAIQLATVEINLIWNPVPLFIDVFTTILLSRFILNLRALSSSDLNKIHTVTQTTTATYELSSRFTAPRFATVVVGNLGEDLVHGGGESFFGSVDHESMFGDDDGEAGNVKSGECGSSEEMVYGVDVPTGGGGGHGPTCIGPPLVNEGSVGEKVLEA